MQIENKGGILQFGSLWRGFMAAGAEKRIPHGQNN
jgi:hypothetical protein